MTDKDDLLPAWPNMTLLLSSLALVVALMFGAVTGYLTLEVLSLNREMAQLKKAQPGTGTALPQAPEPRAGETPAPAPAGAPMATAPVAPDTVWIASATPEAVEAIAPERDNAAATAQTASPQAAAPVTAAPPNVPSRAVDLTPVYSARVFVPSTLSDKAKLDRFVNTVKTSGIDVGVTQDDVGQPETSSMLYHPSAGAVAKKVAAVLKAKYPSLNLEMQESGTIPASAWNIVIISLAADALN